MVAADSGGRNALDDGNQESGGLSPGRDRAGLRRVAELGIGQSKAVARAAHKEQVGCLWHERHFGVHLGLGAGLHEAPGRVTQHHLDIVLANGALAGESGRTILAW